jgi:hypothetical protein
MSPEATVSPSFTSHFASVPSSIVGESAGILSSIGMEASLLFANGTPAAQTAKAGQWSSLT